MEGANLENLQVRLTPRLLDYEAMDMVNASLSSGCCSREAFYPSSTRLVLIRLELIYRVAYLMFQYG